MSDERLADKPPLDTRSFGERVQATVNEAWHGQNRPYETRVRALELALEYCRQLPNPVDQVSIVIVAKAFEDYLMGKRP